MIRFQTYLTGFMLVFFVARTAMAQTEPGMVFFEGSWQEVLDEAKRQRKLVFVDAFTTWCGPCKMMARNTFTDEAVGKFFNKHFVNYKFDMEKGEGPGFAAKYGVRAYPTIFFINYKGEAVHQHVGFLPPDKFLEQGTAALAPEKNAANEELKGAAGDAAAADVYANAMRLKRSGEAYGEAANKYFSMLTEKQLLTREGWEAIRDLSTNYTNPEFQLLIAKRKNFEKIAGPAAVEAKIADVFRTQALQAARDADEDGFNKALAAAQKLGDNGKTAARMQMAFAEARSDWQKYAEACIAFFKQHTSTDAEELHHVATLFEQHITDPAQLGAASGWARQAAALKQDHKYSTTHAALLFKSGQHDEALRIANKTRGQLEAAGLEYPELDELIERIKSKTP